MAAAHAEKSGAGIAAMAAFRAPTIPARLDAAAVAVIAVALVAHNDAETFCKKFFNKNHEEIRSRCRVSNKNYTILWENILAPERHILPLSH